MDQLLVLLGLVALVWFLARRRCKHHWSRWYYPKGGGKFRVCLRCDRVDQRERLW